jgi:penicillin amidase
VLEADDPTIHRAMVAYAAGVSAYIDDAIAGTNGATLPPQFAALGYTPEPWTAHHTAAIEKLITAGLAMRPDQDLILGLIKTLLGDDAFGDVYRYTPFDEALVVPGFLDSVPAARSTPSAARSAEHPSLQHPVLQQLAETPSEDLLAALQAARAWNMSMGGSNSMAIAAEHSASGHALLASDSHQGIEHPAVYYAVHLSTAESGGDLDVVGATFPGVPFVMFGHNARVAWGPTTSIYDCADAYLEVADGSDAVMFEGASVPLEVTPHTIQVAGGEPVQFDAELVPHHGPMFPADDLPLPVRVSIRWTGYDARSAARAFYELNTAGDFDEFRGALSHYFTGGMHWVYADVEGDIGYSSYSDLPIREVVDPTTPPVALLPGDGGYEWLPGTDRSYAHLSEEQVPWVFDPPQGWLATANNDPVGQTHDNTPFDDAIYLSGVFDVGTRAYQPVRRFEELVADDGSVSFDELKTVQLDTTTRLGERLLPFLLEAADRRPDLLDTRSAEAVSLLSDWADSGHPCGIDDVGPTLFHAWFAVVTREILEDEFGGLLGDLLFEQMDYKFGLVTSKFLLHFLEVTDADLADIEAGTVPFPSNTGTNYFDDSRTPELETRDAVLLAGLSLALDELEGIFASKGADPLDLATWRWGLWHTIHLEDAALDSASSDTFEKPGALFTVDVGDYDLLLGGVLPDTLNTTNAPSNRFVFELAPGAIRGEWILPGGQSENPDSPFHNDMLQEYVDGEHRPMRFYREEVEAGVQARWQVPSGFPDSGSISVE